MQIFITGVSSGIGRELVKQLTSVGHNVWGVARREELLKELFQEIGSDTFHYERCDIADRNQIANVFSKMRSMNFQPDIVILNAAIEREDPYLDFDMDNARYMLRANMEGSLTWISHFIQPFLEKGSGQFVYVSSLFAIWPDPSCPAYAASKAGLSMAFRSFSSRYAKTNIKFKLVYLGSVNTAINPRFTDTSSMRQPFYVMAPQDVALYIRKALISNRNIFCYPFYMSILYRAFRWLPDSWFNLIFSRFKR